MNSRLFVILSLILFTASARYAGVSDTMIAEEDEQLGSELYATTADLIEDEELGNEMRYSSTSDMIEDDEEIGTEMRGRFGYTSTSDLIENDDDEELGTEQWWRSRGRSRGSRYRFRSQRPWWSWRRYRRYYRTTAQMKEDEEISGIETPYASTSDMIEDETNGTEMRGRFGYASTSDMAEDDDEELGTEMRYASTGDLTGNNDDEELGTEQFWRSRGRSWGSRYRYRSYRYRYRPSYRYRSWRSYRYRYRTPWWRRYRYRSYTPWWRRSRRIVQRYYGAAAQMGEDEEMQQMGIENYASTSQMLDDDETTVSEMTTDNNNEDEETVASETDALANEETDDFALEQDEESTQQNNGYWTYIAGGSLVTFSIIGFITSYAQKNKRADSEYEKIPDNVNSELTGQTYTQL